MAKVRSNAHLYLTQTGDAAPLAEALTSVTKANPSVMTLATANPDMAAGDFGLIEGTDDPHLDGKAFRFGAIGGAGTTAELSDFDGEQMAADATGGTVQIFDPVDEGDGLLEACMANITVNGQAPDSINLDDMCDQTTVLGAPKPPTFTFTGWVNQDSAGFKNLIQASLESPKTARYMLIDYGDDAGYIFGPVEIGEVSVTAGVNAGLQFTGTGVFKEVPTYSWAL